jgi:hypothetical protein
MAKRNAKHAIKALTLATLKTTGFEFRFENSKLKQVIKTKKIQGITNDKQHAQSVDFCIRSGNA